jgi:hypothetical protein
MTTENVGEYRLHWEKNTRQHLLGRRRMENVIDPLHGTIYTGPVTHITNVELEPVVLQRYPHMFFFQFITGKDTNLWQSMSYK